MSFSLGSAISSSSAAGTSSAVSAAAGSASASTSFVGDLDLDGLVVTGLEVFQVQIRLVYVEVVAGLDLELVGNLNVVGREGFFGGFRFRCGGLLRAAAGSRRVGGLGP